ncbi:hybrid sensor histidine kinase/response regulator [Vibrio sp. HA2012]|uniref:ATP-binding protein n=1 Tax=Vibrio sp. HA2012 TaxID=1971595 RepID=UPI000C2C0B31|nr:ATP-binding protein [Vibrio sp. HA2012]PJC86879.1 hybrid sensor histidine kinase/response regulator [Vibrio sp. HA2012]
MNLSTVFDQKEHDNVIIECFSHLWQHSVDFMFIMAVEENGEFSLYDNNPASRAVMGIDPEQSIHRYNIRETWGDEVVEGLYITYQKAINARKPISADQFATTADGPIYVNTLFVPIFDDNDNPLFVCGVSRDVSQIKEAEQIAVSANAKLKEYSQALENINTELDNKVKRRTQELEKITTDLKVALEAKSSFVSHMSHEIRTPINAMLGLSKLLQTTRLDDTQQDYVHKILDAGHILMGVINDILDFSKIEAEKLQPECIHFDPKKMVMQASDICKIKADEKNLEFILHIDPSIPRSLMGDPLRIQQIIINLLSNAVKFTENGTVSLEAHYDPTIPGSAYLHMVVSDTGIGISQEQQQNLFTPFTQADSSITRNYGGTGLGLVISKKLCELMGGSLSVNSEPGQGSRFTIRLPLAPALQTEIVDYPEQAPSPMKDLSAYKLLLVDDNPINQQVAAGFLQDSGIQIDIADNGEAAIEKIRLNTYDIILMDLQMPKLDGISATRHIRTHFNMSIPIIALTAHANDSTIRECLKNGMNAHLSKPLDADKLYALLTEYLDAQPDILRKPVSIPERALGHSDCKPLIHKLSTIEGLDVTRALHTLHHADNLFLSLIQSFYNRYIDSSLLTQHTETLSRTQLTDEIHSLKSNSAYIGALDLSSRCAIVEQKLRTGEISVDVIPVIDQLKALITSLKPLLCTEREKQQNSEQKLMSLTSCLDTMSHQLAQSDFLVEQTLLNIKSQISDSSELSKSIAYISSLVEEVEFEKALEISKSIVTGFSNTGIVADGN